MENKLNQNSKEVEQIIIKYLVEILEEDNEIIEGGTRQRKRLKIVEEKVTKLKVTSTERRKIKVEYEKSEQQVLTEKGKFKLWLKNQNKQYLKIQ